MLTLGRESMKKARGIRAAVTMEYLKKAAVAGGIWAMTILVLIIDRLQAKRARDISNKANLMLLFRPLGLLKDILPLFECLGSLFFYPL